MHRWWRKKANPNQAAKQTLLEKHGLPVLATEADLLSWLGLKRRKDLLRLLRPHQWAKNLLVFVEITLAQKSEHIFKKVRDELQNMPEVLECHLISGSFDYLVKVRLTDMSEYRHLLGSILQHMPVPAQSNSYVVMEEVKESFVIPVQRGKI